MSEVSEARSASFDWNSARVKWVCNQIMETQRIRRIATQMIEVMGQVPVYRATLIWLAERKFV